MCLHVRVRVRVCVRARVCACVRRRVPACVCVCLRVCVCACVLLLWVRDADHLDRVLAHLLRIVAALVHPTRIHEKIRPYLSARVRVRACAHAYV